MRSELSTIARHALTVLAGQLAVMAFGVTDTIVAGRYSPAALAALSVASAVFISVYISLMGILQALLPLWSEQRGAGRLAAIGGSLRQSLYLCLGICVVGMSVLLSPEPLLRWTDVPEALEGDVRRYLAILAWGLPAAMLFRIYSTLNQSLGRPLLVTWLQLGALALKLPLSVWFTFGGAGLPALGVAGCAWATLVVNYTLFGVGLWLLRTQPLYVPLQLWQRMERIDWRRIGQFLRLGLPAGMAILVEVTSFTLVALFVARQGNLAAASHQIAANLAGVCYMVPLSLAIATSARVSWWRGAGNEAQAQQLVALGWRLAALLGLLLGGLLLAGRYWLTTVYTSDAQVAALAGALLLWVAAYHVADSVQCFCVFVLRCYRITVVPLLTYCVLLWGGGLAGGYWLAYGGVGPWSGRPTPAPFWAMSALALWVTALAFSALLWRTLRRHRAPGAQPS
ncbi:MATE family efflux transporter [Comamonas endophytica]|uniref:MATE family efflux transporter n=1 Tax=Comamonas endophytica TaxID=2949090 RepID=A0ABY6GB84_9BURK|nr:MULTISPECIES: MATE family efflux transporter [unclassified Acidovorax]MCD2513838.1 MATE family efflux transporter [Acidovorax sp. D4N7]UYG52161.1 MATE family efflux transporter [Acidovorax sp. 5MLIR]